MHLGQCRVKIKEKQLGHLGGLGQNHGLENMGCRIGFLNLIQEKRLSHSGGLGQEV
jgi:hypothetical protein